MALLDEAIDASGGLRRWNGLKRFVLQLSIDGARFSRLGQAGRFKDVVAEGSTQTQLLRFTGFGGPDTCGLYRPEGVTIEAADGQVLRRCGSPRQAFRHAGADRSGADLYLVFFCGFAVWNY